VPCPYLCTVGFPDPTVTIISPGCIAIRPYICDPKRISLQALKNVWKPSWSPEGREETLQKAGFCKSPQAPPLRKMFDRTEVKK
jgi:hypothetical protein